MKGQTHGGKGSTQRPTDQQKFATNWESIFSKTLNKAKENVTETDKEVVNENGSNTDTSTT